MADRPTDHVRAEAAFAEFRRSGSPRAMAEVFDRTAAELLLCARRFSRDASAAEDLVQQTFLRAIERAATFAPDRQLMPWLTTILANEARMELRRRRTPDPDRLLQSESEEPSHTAERREAAAAMHAALAELPPAYRDVVALRYLHDTRPGRIATALALPLPTVKTRLHRGVHKLKASLPRGLTLGTAVALCAGRGLPACRHAVLRSAGTSTAAIWTLTGLLAMKKTVLPVAILALLLATVWLLLPTIWSDSPVAGAPATAGAAGTLASGAATSREQRSDGDPAAAVRTTVDVPQPQRERRLHAIEVRARWRTAGQPAAGIPFTLLTQPDSWLASATTNDAGTATFDIDRIDDLEHKARMGVSITCALSPGRYHNVSAADSDDSPRIVEVELDDGRHVTGIVLDATGLPVAGACIWLTVDQFQAAMVFQHSDAAGRFGLRGLSDEFTIRATHEGAASADLAVANLDGDREAVLRLNATAARLEVLVTDPTGTPLAGTAVHLDDRNRNYRKSRRRFATTGADGRATLAGIDEAEYHLEVVHPSFAPAQLEITIADDQQRRETIKLGPAAELAGCVRRANGDAVAGAWVTVGNDAATLLERSANTDREGKFVLQALAIGRHRLSIRGPVPDHSRFIELRAGRQELEVTLPGSRPITGQLVDPDGRPLPSWHVQARAISDFNPVRATTDAEGRFVFHGLSEALFLLEVGPQWRTVATFLDVRTDGSEQIFRLPKDAVPRAFLLGRVEGVRECSLVISPRIKSGDANREHLTVPADGRFEFGPLPPVAFDVGLSLSSGNRIWWFTSVDLAAADRCDLGTIRMPEPGRLEVTVRDDLRCEQLSVGVRPVVAGTQVESLERVDQTSWRATDLPAGDYDVCLFGEATAPVMQRITLESSRTTRLALATAPGAVLAYRLVPTAGTPWEAIGWQMLTIRNADGNLVAFDQVMGSLNHSKRLLAGSYTFEVATGGGFHGTAAAVVPPAEGAELAIPITR